jgi:hypothetical protein
MLPVSLDCPFVIANTLAYYILKYVYEICLMTNFKETYWFSYVADIFNSIAMLHREFCLLFLCRYVYIDNIFIYAL